ncbi:hypothetical protein ACFL08_05295 [Patescibacteria group bacterium]
MSDMKEKANNLKHLTKCSLCGGVYHHDRTVVLDESDSNTTIHVTCQKCNTSALVFISNNQQNIVSLGIATDMKGDEAVNLFNKCFISDDDVLDVYRDLKIGS